jgi:hypothetical protein
MDEFDTDIFTFRRSDADSSIVDDVVFKYGFLDAAFQDLLAKLNEDDIYKITPIVLGHQYLAFH